jgi:streptogramin lyase
LRLDGLENRCLLSITEFPLPSNGSVNPVFIAAGPDGNIWFEINDGPQGLGMINPASHAITEFSTGWGPITAGPDGNVWFADTAVNPNTLGMINPATYAISVFAIPTANSDIEGITTGPDGNIWFTETSAGKIGEINPTTHVFTEFSIPTAGSQPRSITTGPDGNLWFTEGIGNIGTIDLASGAITEFPLPAARSFPSFITAGPDGDVWFTVPVVNGNTSNVIGKINPSTKTITEFNTPTAGSYPNGITRGPDGKLWFTETMQGAGQIGTIDPTTGVITEIAVPYNNSGPWGITTGSDGNIWFADWDADAIGVITPGDNSPGVGILAGPIRNPANGHDYYLLTQSNWTDAEAEAIELGGHLATIDDAAENAWVVSNFSEYQNVHRSLWIGLTDQAVEGTFVWTSGEPVTYTNWAAGEPNNNGGNEDWVEILPSTDSRSPGWNDAPNYYSSFGFVMNGVVEVNTSHLAVVQQPPAGVIAGSPFGLTVQAEDSSGNLDSAFNGIVTVALASNPGGATLGGTLSATAKNGVATFSDLTLTAAADGYTLQISSTGVDSATTNAITVTAAAATQLTITLQPPASVVVGGAFGLQATIEDAYGNIETGDSAAVEVALVGNAGGADVGGTLSVNASQGVANFSGLTLDTIGSGYTLQVSSSGLPRATSNPITVNPVPATKLVITKQPSANIVAGAPFGLTVQAEDDSGDLASSFTGSVTVALASNPSGDTLGGTLTLTAAGGVATFSGLMLTTAASGYTIVVSSTGMGGATTTAFNVGAAPASQAVITKQPPASIVAGTSFGFEVRIEDPYGNLEPGAGNTVTAALANNPGGTTLGGTVSVTASSGVATFSGLSLTRAASGYTLQISSSGLSGATSGSITVSAGAAAALSLANAPPSSVTAGTEFGLSVAVDDEYGNLTSFGGSVTVAIASGPADASVSGQTTVTAAGGVATFAGLALAKAGNYEFQVSIGAIPVLMIGAMTVAPDAPSQLVIAIEPPDSINAGSDFGLAVMAEDQLGNATPSFSGNVTINGGGDSLGGTLTVAAEEGLATFSGLTIDTAGTYTLAISSGGLSGAMSSSITVTPLTAIKLRLTSEPPLSVTAGEGFSFGVEAEDAFGNVATSFDGRITATIATGPGGATLGGTVTETASSGVVNFAGLMADQAGSGYVLQVAGAGLSGATTGEFAVTSGSASHLVIATEPPESVTAGDPFALSVVVEDRFGNVATSYQGPVSIELANNGGRRGLSGTLALNANAGVAVFSGLALDTALSGFMITASSGSLVPVTSGSIDVAPGNAAELIVWIPPPSSMTAGSDFGLAFATEDAYGNIATSFAGSVTVSLANNPGAAILSGGPLTVAARSGVANFPADLTLDTAGAGYTIRASSFGLEPVTTSAITVTSLPATHLIVLTQPPATVVPGARFGLVVAAVDPFGNIDPSFGGRVGLATSNGGGLAGNTLVTASGGEAAFNGLHMSAAGVPVPLQVTSAGLIGTATNPVSESAPAQVAFGVARVVVNENAGLASIQLVRSGEYHGAVSVVVATGGGTAVAGVNYTPIDEVASFGAGQESETITIPVKDDGVVTPDLVVNVVLSDPGEGAILGSVSTATVVLHDVDESSATSALVNLNGVRLVLNKHHKVMEILVGFTGGLNARDAKDTAIYRLTRAGKGGSFTAKGATVLKLRSAVYQAASDLVALTPRKPVSLVRRVQLVVDGVRAGGLHDSAGRLIDGNNDGSPGGDGVVVITRRHVSVSASVPGRSNR